jgi:hypothetical protein
VNCPLQFQLQSTRVRQCRDGLLKLKYKYTNVMARIRAVPSEFEETSTANVNLLRVSQQFSSMAVRTNWIAGELPSAVSASTPGPA